MENPAAIFPVPANRPRDVTRTVEARGDLGVRFDNHGEVTSNGSEGTRVRISGVRSRTPAAARDARDLAGAPPRPGTLRR